MNKYFKFAKRLSKDEEGATAIEYGLLAALIAVVLITAMTNLGGELNETFVGIEADLAGANVAAPAADQ